MGLQDGGKILYVPLQDIRPYYCVTGVAERGLDVIKVRFRRRYWDFEDLSSYIVYTFSLTRAAARIDGTSSRGALNPDRRHKAETTDSKRPLKDWHVKREFERNNFD